MAYVGLFGVMEYIFPVILAVSIIFLMVNRELLRVARIKTAAGYGLFVVLCAMIQCLYNKPDIADNGLGSILHIVLIIKPGVDFLADCYCKVLSPIGSIGTFDNTYDTCNNMSGYNYGEVFYIRA